MLSKQYSNMSVHQSLNRGNSKCFFFHSIRLLTHNNSVHHPSRSLSLSLSPQNLHTHTHTHTSVIFEKGEDADHNLEKDYEMPPTPLRLEEQQSSSGSICSQLSCLKTGLQAV